MNNFLNIQGLATFLNKLRETFATTYEVTQIETDNNTYILNIDYSLLQFDTTEIIKEGV